jgi:hypothetical protein
MGGGHEWVGLELGIVVRVNVYGLNDDMRYWVWGGGDIGEEKEMSQKTS